jgi:hypothetical protein
MRFRDKDSALGASIWGVVCLLFILFVALTLFGCATGMPGSPVRSFYNLCMRETNDTTYCEAWANSQGLSGQVGVQMVVPFPGR